MLSRLIGASLHRYLIEVPFHVRFVIQQVREHWCMSFLDHSGAIVYCPIIGVIMTSTVASYGGLEKR